MRVSRAPSRPCRRDARAPKGADMPIPFPNALTCPREPRAALDDARDTKRGIPLKLRCRSQWGQRLLALDTVALRNKDFFWNMLQWGQRHSALDTWQKTYSAARSLTLQWGQRLSALGTRRCIDLHIFRQPCFNGANAIQRWILETSAKGLAYSGLLQWGQRHSALDTAFSPRFSLIIALFGGRMSSFARGSFFWLPNRAGFRPSEPLLDRFFANAPSWAVYLRSARSPVWAMSWISRGRGHVQYPSPMRLLAPANPARLWTTHATRNGASAKTALPFSMGPTPFSVGYVRTGDRRAEGERASMGPTPFSVGYRFRPKRCARRRPASMGPTPFSVGY